MTFSSCFYHLINLHYPHIVYCIYWVVSADPKKIDHLRALDGSAERLQLFKADLLEEGSFDAVVQGCECVFHTASPFYNNPKDPQVFPPFPSLFLDKLLYHQ